MATDKQLGMIMHLLSGESGKVLKGKLPKNSEKYPRQGADYSGAMLSDFIETHFDIKEASMLIQKLQDYKYPEAEALLRNKGLKI